MDELRKKREYLRVNTPACPNCSEDFQIQLVEWVDKGIAEWKCRTCKHKWETEYVE